MERAIEEFRIDTQRFFAGDLKLPPDGLQERIQSELRRLRNDAGKGVAESFRLGSLEARFHSQLELHNRRLREREQGEGRPAAERDDRPDPERGVVLGSRNDPQAVAVLYKGLYLRPGQETGAAVDLERFRSYLSRQVETIRSQTGCSRIRFRVAVEDGKPKLKAQPIKGPAG